MKKKIMLVSVCFYEVDEDKPHAHAMDGTITIQEQFEVGVNKFNSHWPEDIVIRSNLKDFEQDMFKQLVKVGRLEKISTGGFTVNKAIEPDQQSAATCPMCNGTGIHNFHSASTNWEQINIKCANCHGAGLVGV